MKKLLVAIFLLSHLACFAVANYFTGAVNSHFSNASNWSTLAVPTANDGNIVSFHVVSITMTIDVVSFCNNIDFTNFTGSLVMTNSLTVSGNITGATGITISGSSALITNATGTLTSNGMVWPNTFTLSGPTSQTYTFADNWSVSTLSISATTAVTLAGAYTINCSSLSVTTSNVTSSTTSIVMNGTGTWSGSGAIGMNLTFNSAGTITVSGSVQFGVTTSTLLYTAGTMIVTSSTLTLNSNATINTSGMTWNNVTIGNGQTVTLSSNLVLSGNITTGGNGTVNGAFKIVTSGGASGGTGNGLQGTASLLMNGTGTIGQTIAMAIEINTAGTITVSAANGFTLNGATMTFTAVGSFVTAGAEVHTRTGAVFTVNVSGIAFETFTSLFANETTTWNGTNAVSFGTFNGFHGDTYSFTAGTTYPITTAWNMIGTAASQITLKSATPSSSTLIPLTVGATQNIRSVKATDIDSSGGQTIDNKQNGTQTRTVNWRLRSDNFFPFFQ